MGKPFTVEVVPPKGENTTHETRLAPIVTFDYDDLNPRGGHGEEAARIVVNDGDKRVIFWVRVRDNGHGKVTCEVQTKRGETNTRKTVTGNWEKP